jgi:hypothetical protein
MKRALSFLAVALVLGVAPIRAAHVWAIPSPDHGQTFAYGSEKHRQWMDVRGHLALAMNFTNDPHVDNVNPRQYDDFIFDFPDVILGRDGRTFYYQPPGAAHPVAVALRTNDIFGDIRLLPSTQLLVHAPHGYLSLILLTGAAPDSAAGG